MHKRHTGRLTKHISRIWIIIESSLTVNYPLVQSTTQNSIQIYKYKVTNRQKSKQWQPPGMKTIKYTIALRTGIVAVELEKRLCDPCVLRFCDTLNFL